MDPLEKALIKARKRKNSQKFDEPDQPAEVTTTASEAPKLRAVEPQNWNTLVSEFHFTNTRIKPVSSHILDKHRLVAGENSSIADRYRFLRVQVFRRLSQFGGRALGVVSANSGAGKSLTAANLAISMAMDPNHTVLLVDFDLRRPTLHRYFDLNEGPALADYFEGEADLGDCLVSPGIGRLVVLPVGRPVRNSSEVLVSKQATELIQELASRYTNRVVIFDLPPLLIGDDALVVLENIRTALLVVREGLSQAGELQACLSILEEYHLLGTVLNCSNDDNLYPYY